MSNEEIPAGLKEYLFAMYIRQRVLMLHGLAGPIEIFPGALNGIDNDCLQLRPLSSITNDEAIEVAKLNGWATVMSRNEMISHGKSDILNLDTDYHLSIFAYQYLQQQGFALPVFYKGVQYPVEQLTDWGFIKIKA